jgi:hypothetical protein
MKALRPLSFLRTYEKATLIVSLVASVVGAIYCAVTIGMFFATKEAADAATKAADTAALTMRLDQRAWVAVTAVNGARPEPGQKFSFSVHFIDTGKTPAINVTIHPGDEILEFGHHPDLSLDTNPVRLGLLSPGSERTYENTFNRGAVKLEKLEKEDIEFLKSKTLSVHGRIAYDDIFGCHHWVTYSAYLKSDWSGYGFYPEGNDTDSATDARCGVAK